MAKILQCLPPPSYFLFLLLSDVFGHFIWFYTSYCMDISAHILMIMFIVEEDS